MSARRIFVSGHVQGVFFREWTRQQADRLRLSGWVRNRSDGRVEILAVGEAATIAMLVEACRSGPSAAKVEEVSVEEAEEEAVEGFTRRATV